jgi:hypothetical protein
MKISDNARGQFRKYAIVASTIVLIGVSLVLIVDADTSRVVRFFSKLTLFTVATGIAISLMVTKLLGKQRARLALASVVVFALLLFVTFFAAEAVTRFVFRDITTTGDNTSYFARHWRGESPPVLNHWGFREREFSSKPVSGTYRIAIVGDSFTYGQGIAVEDRFSNILEHQLNRDGRRYEVLNFGRPGAETVDHVQILRDVVLDIEPDFVLLQWFVNDVEGRDSERPRAWRLIPSDTLGAFLHRHSALYYLLNQEWIKFQRRVGLTESYQTYMERQFKDPQTEASREANAALSTFFKICRNRGIAVGVVLFPTLSKHLGKAYPFAFLLNRVLKMCNEQGVICLDLRKVFASVSPPSRLWANRLDSHPGPLANRLAAESILRTFERVWAAQRKPGVGHLSTSKLN